MDLKGRDYVPSTVQQVNLLVDVTDAAQRAQLFDVRPPTFTDGVHPHAPLPSLPRSAEEKSEAQKRAKLQLAVALINKYRMERVIIFCRTNLDCANLEAFFRSIDQRYSWRIRSTGGPTSSPRWCWRGFATRGNATTRCAWALRRWVTRRRSRRARRGF